MTPTSDDRTRWYVLLLLLVVCWCVTAAHRQGQRACEAAIGPCQRSPSARRCDALTSRRLGSKTGDGPTVHVFAGWLTVRHTYRRVLAQVGSDVALVFHPFNASAHHDCPVLDADGAGHRRPCCVVGFSMGCRPALCSALRMQHSGPITVVLVSPVMNLPVDLTYSANALRNAARGIPYVLLGPLMCAWAHIRCDLLIPCLDTHWRRIMMDVLALPHNHPPLDVPTLLLTAREKGIRVIVLRGERDWMAQWNESDWTNADVVELLGGAGHIQTPDLTEGDGPVADTIRTHANDIGRIIRASLDPRRPRTVPVVSS